MGSGTDQAGLLERSEQALAAALGAFADGAFDTLVAELSAAVRGFTAAGEPRRASTASVLLGQAMTNVFGNAVAGRVWFDRAWRLVADLPECPEQGWAAIAPMGCDTGDPERLVARADLALAIGRRFGDVNLEAKALADGGLARVQLGLAADGLAMLDEAMTLVCGPADDDDAAGRSVCSFFTACYYSADFDRAEAWADALRRRGLLGAAAGPQVWLSNHCDTVRAYALVELGRWAEAEAVLLAASDAFTAAMGFDAAWHPAIALADLRIAQGRLTEAEQLLLGKDAQLEALLPMARLHLARGDHALAAATARRGLALLGADRLRAVELLTVLAGTALAAGDLPSAASAAAEIAARAEGIASATVRARCALPRAEVCLAQGDPRSAVDLLDAALGELGPTGGPWLRARLACAAARAHAAAGDVPAAMLDAKAAGALVSGLDVVLSLADRAALDRFAGDVAGRQATAALRRDGKWWDVACDGRQARVAATKGLSYLAELVAQPGIERHVLDLLDRVDGDPATPRRVLGDAGALLDAAARRAYRARIEELRAAADDALARGDDVAAEQAQDEVDALAGELARAFGLGGRERRAASAAERARLNVTRAIRSAIARLCETLPDAGPVLDRRVRTGTFCVYEPEPTDPARWIVQS